MVAWQQLVLVVAATFHRSGGLFASDLGTSFGEKKINRDGRNFTPVDVAIAERPSKRTFHASSSASSASGPDVWADLLDSLLLQISGLLISFHDLLAFLGTCRSWRTVLSSLPGPPAFTFNIPPLRLQQIGCDSLPHCSFVKRTLLSNIKWQLVDPAKQTSSLCCSAPRNVRVHMQYLGCSYGYLIFSNFEQCLLVDVYSGSVMRTPKRKSTRNRYVYYGILVAPINASNSHLLICSGSSMFQWKVGSSSWLEYPLDGGNICQIISFKGQVFAMDSFHRLHRVHLAPQLSMHELAVVWGEDMVVGLTCKPWLVVCGDMLLLVVFSVSVDNLSGFSKTFKVLCLDFSIEPAKWVRMDNLGDNALFVSTDRRNPTFSCMSPERWGGKGNSIYITSPTANSNESWSVTELGQEVPSTELYAICRPDFHRQQPQSLWVLPSFVYGVGL